MEFKKFGVRRGTSFLLGSVLALLTSFGAQAAEAESTSTTLIDEVVVTASLLETSDVGSLGYAHLVSGKEIADGATTGLGEVLNDLLGMSTTDFGSAVSRPTIRGLTGDRVRVLNNGVRARDVSGLGADHSMDVDLFNVEQIEVIKGPGSLLYTNGAIGGIVNVVDDTIASEDFSESESVLGMETQSVNNGQVEFLSHKANIGGFNVTASYRNAEFENYEVPKGAVAHSEHMHDAHDGEDEHDDDHGDDHGDEHGDEHHEDPITSLANSDYGKETMRFGISKVGSWGHVGVSYASNEGLYGIPFHSEAHSAHDDDHDDGHDDHDDGHDDHDDGHDDHDDGHDDEHDGHDEHEDERIFARTESDIINLEGSLILDNGFLKSVSYHFRDTDYVLTEAHAEESDAHDDDDGHHAHAGPTVFTNDAQEFGAVFDFSNDILTQKIAVAVVSEDTAIVGEEAFMNPVSTDEVTLGYYASRQVGGFIIDFGIRNDWVDRSGSVSTEEEHGHDEEDHDEEEHEEEEHHEEAELQYFNSEDSITSYGLQIARPFNEQFRATLNLSSVEKAPAAVELFMNGAHLATGRYEVGNPDLDTERAKSAEFTLDYSSETFFGSVTLYTNSIDNYIYLRDETEEEHEEHEEHGHEHGGLILANYVQQDAEFHGYEFEIGRVFQVAGGDLTLSYGLDSVSADFSDNSNVPRINPDRSIYQAAYARGSFDMQVVFKDIESQTDTASYEEFTKGYSMLNVRASNTFALADGLALNVSLFGSNLLNEIARNHSSFVKDEVPLPGRSYGLKFYAAF